MKPFEFIDFAQRLAVQPATTPAVLRSITSRAYYGAFHLAKEFMAKLGQPTTTRHDAHSWLLGSQAEDAHQAGRLLADLNSARIRADYRLDDQFAESIHSARRSGERAVEFQALLKKCETLPPEKAIARRA